MFLDIPGTNGYYSCDEEGNIRSNERECWNGKVFYKLKERILKPYINNKGYKVVDLRINNKTEKRLVHRLVAETFIPNPHNKKLVGHKDNNPLNCNVNNLEWCSSSENNQYAYDCGRRELTEEMVRARKKKSDWLYKKVKQYSLNGEFIKEYDSITQAALETGSNKTNISACCNNVQKTHKGYLWRFS